MHPKVGSSRVHGFGLGCSTVLQLDTGRAASAVRRRMDTERCMAGQWDSAESCLWA
jgi:hypothetical protein